MNINSLLEIEKSKDILDCRFQNNNIPMYVTIRFGLLQSLINKKFDLSNPHIQPDKFSIINKLHYAFHTLKSNLFFSPNKEIYIFSTGNVNKFENGQYINKLYNNFYNIYPTQTQILETSIKRSYLLPKKEKIYFRDLMEILIVLISKFFKIKKADKENIAIFLNYLNVNSKINIEQDILNEIETNLLKLSKRLNVSIFLYKWFFKIKKPKLIIVEDGHYGGYGHIFKVAKELGIKTAEYQHGYISLAHPAYNISECLYRDINEFLPEYFLTHGKYWSDKIRTPAKKVEIGLPDLSTRLTQYLSTKKSTKKILFISGGTVYKPLNSLIISAIDDLYIMGYEVLLRPHPSELPALDKRYGNLITKNVTIDTSPLYDTLANIDIVVGMEVSTVLFEAICFSKKIYLMNTPYTSFYEQNSIFLAFENSRDLLLSIKENRQIDLDSNYFWDNSWKNNYNKFIDDILKLDN